MSKEKIGIYMFTNNLKKNDLGEPLKYIGQSIDIDDRYRSHKGMYGSLLIYEDFEKFGFENFSFEILQECLKEELNELEMKYIKEHDSFWPNGYNLTRGGSTQTEVSELTIEKLRIANIGENNPMFGTSSERLKEGNPMYNRRQSLDAREKIAARSRRDIHPLSRKIEDKSGRVWSCIKECAEFFKVTYSHLVSGFKKQRNFPVFLRHLDLHYLNERPYDYEFVSLEELEKNAIPRKIMNYKKPLTEISTCGKKVIDKDGNIYTSIKDCARKINFSSDRLNSFLLGIWNFPPELEPLGLKFLNPEHNKRREDRDNERKKFEENGIYVDQYRRIKSSEKRIIKISDKDGNIYNSVKECAEHFQVRPDKLSCMLNGTRKFNQSLLEFDLKFI